MSSIGEALTDPELDPPVAALVVWNSNPAAIAPDQERVLEGLRRDDLFTIVCEQFMTDTAAHADVVLPATTQLEHLDIVWSWGHHYLTLNEPAIAPLGEARPNSEIFRLLAHTARASRTRASTRATSRCSRHCSTATRPASAWPLCASAATRRSTAARAPTPHAEGGFATRPASSSCAASGSPSAGFDPLPFYDPPGEVADERARRALSARPADAEDPPLPQLHVRQRAAAARRPARPVRRHPSRRCRGARHRRRRRGAGANDRGSFTCRAVVSDDARAGVPVAPMGWWNRDYAGGRSPQATTPQRLTTLRDAPTFNDNRVEIEPA